MKEIDNIRQIKGLLNFGKEGDFYMLYVFKRKKDQPEEERENHQSVRTIKTYCIESIEHLERRYPEVKQLCRIFNARAYIHVQKQNHHDVSLDMMVSLAERIKNGVQNQKGLFDSVVGQIKTQEKRWIVDVDSKDQEEVTRIAKAVDYARPEGPKIEAVVPTKNGYHFITHRFDVKMFESSCPGVDVQKKNPTLLYHPGEIDLKQEADMLLEKYEDEKEHHFHRVDREWLIECMLEFAKLK
jgi:hypothetical protein